MSLIAATIAGYVAYRASKKKPGQVDDYLIGTDVLGEEVGYRVDVPTEAKGQAFIQSRLGAYLTSVAAGLTVAGILGLLGYGLAKQQGWVNGRRK